MSQQMQTFWRERKLSLGVGLLVFLTIAGGLVVFFGGRAKFREVIGMPPPANVFVIRQASSDARSQYKFVGGTRSEWLCFTASKADLQKIIVQGKFRSTNNYFGIGFSHSPVQEAHLGSYVIPLSDQGAPSWWKPAYKEDFYTLYSRPVPASDAPNEDEQNYRSLIVSPNGNRVYALYEIYEKPIDDKGTTGG